MLPVAVSVSVWAAKPTGTRLSSLCPCCPSSAAQQPQAVKPGSSNVHPLPHRCPWWMSWRPGACWRFRTWSWSFLETPGRRGQNRRCPPASPWPRPWTRRTTRTAPRTAKPPSPCCRRRAPTSTPVPRCPTASRKTGEGAEAPGQSRASGSSACSRTAPRVCPCQVLTSHSSKSKLFTQRGDACVRTTGTDSVCFLPPVCIVPWNTLPGSHWEYLNFIFTWVGLLWIFLMSLLCLWSPDLWCSEYLLQFLQLPSQSYFSPVCQESA